MLEFQNRSGNLDFWGHAFPNNSALIAQIGMGLGSIDAPSMALQKLLNNAEPISQPSIRKSTKYALKNAQYAAKIFKRAVKKFKVKNQKTKCKMGRPGQPDPKIANRNQNGKAGPTGTKMARPGQPEPDLVNRNQNVMARLNGTQFGKQESKW